MEEPEQDFNPCPRFQRFFSKTHSKSTTLHTLSLPLFFNHTTGSQQAASGVGENGAPWSLVGRQSPNASLDLIPVTTALGLLQ